MNYLLDTHTVLWAITESPELSATVIRVLENPENQLYLSIASLWEIAIKLNLGKLRLTFSFSELPDKLAEGSVQLLTINFQHLEVVATFPLHHRDPFDRLMVAQTIQEDYILLTNDKALKLYDIKTFW